MTGRNVTAEECEDWRTSDTRPFQISKRVDFSLQTVRRHADGRCRHDDGEEDEDGGTYGGDTYDTRHGRQFKQAREEALERADYRCERCGITDDEHRERDDLFPPNGGLHIHHKVDTTEFDDVSKAHELDNLEVLCAECHGVNGGA